MPLLLSMPLFTDVPKLKPDELCVYLRQHWADIAEITAVEADDRSVSFYCGTTLVLLAIMPAALPWSELEGPCHTSWLWPEALTEVKQHCHHLVITVSDDALEPVPLSALLTQVTAAVLATTDKALGVYWCNAALLVPQQLFIDFAVQVLPNEVPIYLWVDVRAGQDEGGSSGFTTGLEALGLMEIEALQTPEPVAELRERLTSLAVYTIENGPVINDGDTIGESEQERIGVVYSASHFGHEQQVMLLQYR
ncbi:DUF4261 domain-containing protein [Shewanella sp. C32]|uniref:DUF4261 domain-containing protein n=1 Tax=Shewanella electrica TaxID=515560 RepID=A0ABT2FQS3_9GAMM|nr:DUF4261 domain-containing protein [Shewanella electrica]MCH1926077.1 DUF4261 domain-containing protein [Shewanella electrica]MCS4557554.1 DUF4261 domain-containing protein [Shewanella electrica]